MEFSCEYQFEELEIEVNGVFFGFVTGTAELAQDSGYDTFWVKAISLDGEREVKAPSALRSWRKQRVSGSIALTRPHYGRCESFTDFLFEAVEKALYASEKAKEFFNNQMVEAA